ncbi:MAG: arylsulfotransferase family protein [PVC group bacterium]
MPSAFTFVTTAGMILLFWTGANTPINAKSGPAPASNTSQEIIRTQIGTLPYLHGYKPSPLKTGVILYDRSRAYQGLNLYVSGGKPPVILTDMEGNVLHHWENRLPAPDLKDAIFRHGRLFANGDLLVILEDRGLLKMDKDSNTVWFLPGRYHHDFSIAEDGDIYVLKRREAEIDLGWMDLKGPFTEDYVVIISPEGVEKKSISLLECFLHSDYSPVLLNIRLEEHQGDNFHTNTLELIPGSAGERFLPFQKGHALISLRNLHTIAVVDLPGEKVTWALSGMWAHQHHPTLLPNGNILLFDNLGLKGTSQVLEFDPSTQKVAWAYRGNTDNGFRTEDMGFQQRLPNGNTLITESRDGRVFEVTPDNVIVWEFINPQRAAADDSLIAAVYEMERLHPDELAFLGENNR